MLFRANVSWSSFRKEKDAEGPTNTKRKADQLPISIDGSSDDEHDSPDSESMVSNSCASDTSTSILLLISCSG